jgi:hypothetical protein
MPIKVGFLEFDDKLGEEGSFVCEVEGGVC